MNGNHEKSAFLICGDDEFRVSHAARQLAERLVPEAQREFCLEKIDGRVDSVGDTVVLIRRVREALISDGLFGCGRKVIWLHEPSFVANDRAAKSEYVKKNLSELVADIKGGLSEGQTLIVATTKINRASAFFKAFATPHGTVTDFGSALKMRQKNEAAIRILEEFLPLVGLEMPTDVRQSFIARVGTDSRQIVSELEKLACYCGRGATATCGDVLQIVSSGAVSEIWDFIDAFGRRDANELMKQVRIQLEQGENAIRMTNSLLSAVSDLIAVREGYDRRWLKGAAWELPDEIAASLDAGDRDFRTISGFRLRKLSEQADCWTLRDLRNARHFIISLREELVSRALPEAFLLETRLLQAVGIKRRKS